MNTKQIFKFNLLVLLSCITIGLCLISCDKELDVTGETPPLEEEDMLTDTVFFSVEGITVENGFPSSVGFTDVAIKFTFGKVETSSFSIIDFGHVVSSSNQFPTIEDNDGFSSLAPDTPSTGQFTSVVDNLEPGTKYYARVYLKQEDNATGSQSYGYHDYNISFNTLNAEPPGMSIETPSSITASSFLISGKIADFKGVPVSEHGFVWSKNSSQPTVELNDGIILKGAEDIAEGGTFFAEVIDNLDANTNYNITAFAINEFGTGYSDLETPMTLAPPTPFLEIDSVYISSDANNTGTANPGEIVTISVVVKNTGLLVADDVSVRIGDSQKVQILSENPTNYGNIIANGGTKTRQYEVQINDDLFWGEIIDLYFFIEDTAGEEWMDSYSITAESPFVVSENLLYYLDFENQDLFNIQQVENVFGGSNGVVNGNIELSTDTPNNEGFSMDFPGGTYDYIRVPNDPLNSSPEFSLSVWIKTSDSDGCIFDGNINYDGTFSSISAYNPYMKHVILNGTKLFAFGSNTNYNITNVLLNNQWHHLVITKNSQNTLKFYINGDLFDTRGYATYQGGNGAVYSFNQKLNIGVDENDGALKSQYIGKMDNFRMYNRVISESEIEQIYNAKQ